MAMHIIAGSARGRRILTTSSKIMVRPISGRMRQSLFDILRPRVPASHFLDLFAGTGAVGLEAVSRGASKVCFIEKDPRCLKVIEKNLVNLRFEDKAKALRGNVMGPLSWVPFRSGVQRFELIFMGPPYRDEENRPLSYCLPVIETIAKEGLLADDGWVIAQHHRNENVKNPKGLTAFRREKYGDTVMSYFRAP